MKAEGGAPTRAYTMRARASSVAETRRRILLAVQDLATESLDFDPTLDAVAARAGVSVQTLLRHFGNREGLFDAAVQAAAADVEQEREAPVGDVDAAVRVILDHYETRGDFVLRMLARELDDERIARITTMGREVHRDWVRTVFAPDLADLGRARRESRTDLLVIATDVYTWKLLRRDRALSRAETENRLGQLVRAVLHEGESHERPA